VLFHELAKLVELGPGEGGGVAPAVWLGGDAAGPVVEANQPIDGLGTDREPLGDLGLGSLAPAVGGNDTLPQVAGKYCAHAGIIGRKTRQR
jgi:hypothetical protein